MSFSLLDLEREQHRVVSSPASICRLLDMQRHPAGKSFAAFSNWAGVKRWIDRGGIWRESADPLLRPLLAAHQQEADPTWHDILLYLFWHPLARIHGDLWYLEINPGCRCSQIFWAFTRVLQRIDLEQRTDRLGAKIVQDVRHDVRQFYAREQERLRRSKRLEDEIDREDEPDERGVVLCALDSGHAAFELSHDRSWAVARLKAYVRTGQLSRSDYLILIGCHIYGKTLDEMATRLGLAYDATKKRRQRAVNFLNKNVPELSPDLSDTPLEPLRRSPRKEKSHVRKR